MENLQSVTKHRTQVYFPKDLFHRIKKMSKRQDVSISEIIRRAVQKEFGLPEDDGTKNKKKVMAWKKFFANAGIGKGPKDLSFNHDKYFE